MKRKILSLLLAVVLILLAVGLVSCSKTELSTPTNIKYDGKTITWSPVENASGYKVRINEGNEYPVTSSKYPYVANGQQFSVTITAVSGAKKIVDSSAATVMFFPLDGVGELSADANGTISWNAVENADGYEVIIDGTVVETVAVTQYSALPAGTHNIQVRPVVQNDSSYYATPSSAKTVTVLETVAASDITYSNGKIQWRYVPGATCYEVKVNGNILSTSCTGTQFPYDAGNTAFEVTIRAIGNGTNIFSGSVSEAKRFIFLPTVTNIRVEDGMLLWDPVPGADGYKLKLNGSEQQQIFTDCKFEKLAANVDTVVSVMPICNDETFFSSWSADLTVYILGAPVLQWNKDLELDGEANNNVFWDLVAGAVGYEVKVVKPDGTEHFSTYSETQKSFADKYDMIGTYTVAVKSLAEASDSSKCSSAYSVPITVTRLATPERADTNFIVSYADELAKGFTVTFKNISGATQYRLFKDNVEYKRSTTTQFVVSDLVNTSVTEEQTYNFKIQSIGAVETVNGRIYATLSSLSDYSLSFEIKILAMPVNAEMAGYNYTFGTIQGNFGYTVDIGGKTYSSNNSSYDLSILEAGSYSVRVCAKGNGSDVLPSNYTAPITVVRLSAPTNVRVATSDASEGVLTYDTVLNATGYEVIFDNSQNAIPVSEMMNINQYITEKGTTVCMQSVANYYNDDKTTYYMTSQRSATVNFIKLAAPTFGDVAFTNTQLIWKASENMNSAVYTPTYQVYRANGTVYNGEKNGTTMDLSFLEGGQSYTFYVKAIGNGTNYINSEKSTAVTIYKLASPTVTRENGQYVWSGVANTTNYAVYVDGKAVSHDTHVSGEKYSYTPNFTELGTYSVQFFAIGDGGYTTIDSAPTVIEQDTKQLTTPDFKISYSEESYSLTGYIKVEITQESENAKGYSYTVGGVTQTSDALVYTHQPNSVGSFTVRVFALGGNFDEDGVYCINSQSRGGSGPAYTMILLASPNADSIIMNGDGYISWATIDNAVKYELQFSVNGGGFGESEFSNSVGYAISLEGVTSLSVRIRAVGNGNNTVTSEWVEYEFSNLNAQ